jgi:dTMP kinase
MSKSQCSSLKGIFITFEGPEGGGKSTQIAGLAKRLKRAGRKVICTREPGGTSTGEVIRNILQHDFAGEAVFPAAETLLFEASRAQLVEKVIRPALKKGVIVLCDRFTDSTIAYQGYGRGFDVEKIIDINSFATAGLEPDLTILLDVSIECGFERLKGRNAHQKTAHDRMEREARTFHKRVRAGFLKLARRWPRRFIAIDANSDAMTVETNIWAVVKKHL